MKEVVKRFGTAWGSEPQSNVYDGDQDNMKHNNEDNDTVHHTRP